MKIEDRMSMWAAKRPRDEVAELLLEGAQEIADLRRHREDDGKQMGALISGYQKMQGLCIDGKYLTDEEREALESCIADDEAATSYTRATTLRGLLERMRSGALTGCETVSEDGDYPTQENKPSQDILAADEREALAGMASYFDTRGNLTFQSWGSLLRVLLMRL